MLVWGVLALTAWVLYQTPLSHLGNVPVVSPSVALNFLLGGVVAWLGQRTFKTRARHELHTIILKNMAGGVCLIRASDHVIVYTNPKFDRMFGYAAGELYGRTVYVLNYRNTQSGADETVNQIMASIREQGEATYEIHNVRQDGTPFWCRGQASLFEHPEYGTVYVAVQEDVTARKQIEAALQQAELKYRTLVEQVPGIVYVSPLTATADHAYISPYVKTLLGVPQAEWCAGFFNTWQKYVCPDDRDRVVEELQTSISQGVPFFSEYRVFTQDGTVVWLHDHATLVVLADQTRVLQGIAVDITPQKQAEAALQGVKNDLEQRVLERTQALQEANQHLQQLAAIVEFSDDAIFSLTCNGTILTWNVGAERLLGYLATDIVGQSIQVLLPPGVADEIMPILERIYEGERCIYYETVQQHQDGQRLNMSVMVSPIQNADGQIVAVSVIERNITRQKKAEEQLRESEQRFRAVFNQAFQFIWLLSPTGELLEVNQAALEFGGYLRSHVLGKIFWETPWWRVLTTSQSRLHVNVSRAVRGQSVRCEMSTMSATGTVVLLDFSLRPIVDATGQVTLLIAEGRDITERKRLEQELIMREGRLNAFFNASPLGMAIMDEQLRFTKVNEPLAQMNKMPVEHHIGRSLQAVVPGLAPTLEPLYQLVLNTGNPLFNVEICDQSLLPTDSNKWYSLSCCPIFSGKSQPIGVGIIVIDISDHKQAEIERKHAEVQLRQSEANLREAQRIAHIGSLEFDVISQKAICSEETFCILGCQHDFRPSTYDEVVAYIHPDDLPLWQHYVEQAITHGTSYELDCRILRRGGEIRHVEVRGEVVLNSQQWIVRLFCTLLDITDRKQIELELHQAKEAAEAANLAKSIFLANMSHELRTPLNVILGFAQLMSHDALITEAQQENLSTIRRSGDHLLSLINDVLDLSKLEAGRTIVTKTDFDLHELLSTLQSMFQYRAAEKGLQFRLTIAPAVPRYITADQNKLRQVLINLTANAIKFTEKGHVALHVSLVQHAGDSGDDGSFIEQDASSLTGDRLTPEISPHLEPGSYAADELLLRFAIADTGIGIPAEDIHAIFNAFVQSQTSKTTAEGTGLGLTISRRFVELMGGHIAVRSTLNQGSCFWFSIPVQVAHVANLQRVSAPVMGLAPAQPNYRILVADDQPENRQLMVKLMGLLGLSVQEACNGQETVSQWQQWQPHLIWMDLQMPELNGYEATKTIREQEKSRQQEAGVAADRDLGENLAAPAVIIALTAYASNDSRDRALAVGCDDVVTKPFREETILDKLAQHLGLTYVHAEPDLPFSTGRPNAGATLSYECFTAMPPDWLIALQDGAIRCNYQAITDLLTQIPPEQSTLLAGLQELNHNYQFETILELIQPYFDSV